MSDISTFESRIGKVVCSADTFYSFITDLRNFRKIIPDGAASNLILGKEECSFNVNILGTVKVCISEKLPLRKVIFSGSTTQINDFHLIVKILKPGNDTSEVQLAIRGELNPVFKMIAAEPLKKLLETLVVEMENFRGWNDITEYNQPL